MAEFWETNVQDKQMMWGEGPALSALFARDYFLKKGVTNVLIPGVGYGRNAKPFIDAGMTVTGIEVSQTAIDLARSRMELDITIQLQRIDRAVHTHPQRAPYALTPSRVFLAGFPPACVKLHPT